MERFNQIKLEIYERCENGIISEEEKDILLEAAEEKYLYESNNEFKDRNKILKECRDIIKNIDDISDDLCDDASTKMDILKSKIKIKKSIIQLKRLRKKLERNIKIIDNSEEFKIDKKEILQWLGRSLAASSIYTAINTLTKIYKKSKSVNIKNIGKNYLLSTTLTAAATDTNFKNIKKLLLTAIKKGDSLLIRKMMFKYIDDAIEELEEALKL